MLPIDPDHDGAHNGTAGGSIAPLENSVFFTPGRGTGLEAGSAFAAFGVKIAVWQDAIGLPIAAAHRTMHP